MEDKVNIDTEISTHSLTRRLTGMTESEARAMVISTHSLTRRLTKTCLQKRQQMRYFNSQPHKEADHSVLEQQIKEAISTHSLTRRLTAISDKNIFIQN